MATAWFKARFKAGPAKNAGQIPLRVGTSQTRQNRGLKSQAGGRAPRIVPAPGMDAVSTQGGESDCTPADPKTQTPASRPAQTPASPAAAAKIPAPSRNLRIGTKRSAPGPYEVRFPCRPVSEVKMPPSRNRRFSLSNAEELHESVYVAAGAEDKSLKRVSRFLI